MTTTTPRAGEQTVSTYTVTGMTCAHCVASVTAEVGRIPGVANVDVDLRAGTVTVASQAPLDESAVADAVTEAGYDLVPTSADEQPAASCCGTCH
ncbi:heavy-metal-associated domain-containing protein [Streptomyces sp. B6B3]|uniref:heavy-metal-associated domain-containing protein n=1 Tax=Streptomyces sp. B6B3 TaxID=3153570 RepID=UPI00325E64A9